MKDELTHRPHRSLIDSTGPPDVASLPLQFDASNLLGGVFDGGVSPMILVVGIALTVLVLFAVFVALDRSVEDAAERTSRTAVGASAGAGMVAITAAAEGLQALAEAPGIVMGLLGVGGVAVGASVKMMAATVFIALVVLKAVRG
jgi:hypothetical protein